MTSTARGQGIAQIIANLSITNQTTRKQFIKLMSILDNQNLKLIDASSTVIIDT